MGSVGGEENREEEVGEVYLTYMMEYAMAANDHVARIRLQNHLGADYEWRL